MEAKVAEILHFGVPHIWVLDPKQSKAWSYTKESRQDAREVLEIPHPKIVIKLAEIFGALGDEIEL
jgi:hypothetical protein